MTTHPPFLLSRSLGDTLRELRRSKRLSISDVAERAGISRQHVWRIEKNVVTSPGADVLSRLASALDVGIHELIGTGTARTQVLSRLIEHASRISDEDWKTLNDLARRVTADSPRRY